MISPVTMRTMIAGVGTMTRSGWVLGSVRRERSRTAHPRGIPLSEQHGATHSGCEGHHRHCRQRVERERALDCSGVRVEQIDPADQGERRRARDDHDQRGLERGGQPTAAPHPILRCDRDVGVGEHEAHGQNDRCCDDEQGDCAPQPANPHVGESRSAVGGRRWRRFPAASEHCRDAVKAYPRTIRAPGIEQAMTSSQVTLATARPRPEAPHRERDPTDGGDRRHRAEAAEVRDRERDLDDVDHMQTARPMAITAACRPASGPRTIQAASWRDQPSASSIAERRRSTRASNSPWISKIERTRSRNVANLPGMVRVVSAQYISAKTRLGPSSIRLRVR